MIIMVSAAVHNTYLIATSLSLQDLLMEGVYLAGILVCGVIFWLVSRVEGDKK